MALLRSYVGGSWVSPGGEGRPVFDAVTGCGGRQDLRRTALDMATGQRCTYGRTVGGPGLLRADVPPAGRFAQAHLDTQLREHRDELYALSAKHWRRLSVMPGSTSTAGSACCSAMPARPGANCLTTPCATWTAAAGAAGQVRPVRRAAHHDVAARRCGSGERFQLPGLGAAGEVRCRLAFLAGVPRPHQLGQPDRLPHRSAWSS